MKLRFRKKHGIAALLFLLMLPSVLPSAQAVWLLGWQYRRQIVIFNNNTLNLTDFQVMINLTGYSLTGAKQDCSDIRFAFPNGTLLDYFIEECEVSKIFWVKIPFLSAGSTTTIYVYYGNEEAIDMSNASSVFIFYDPLDSTPLDWVKEEGDDAVTDTTTFGKSTVKLPDTSTTSSTIYSHDVSLPNDTILIELEMASDNYDSGYPYLSLILANSSYIIKLGSRGGSYAYRTVYDYAAAVFHNFGTFTESRLEEWGLVLNVSNLTVIKAWGGADVLDQRVPISSTPTEILIAGIGSTYTGDSWFHRLIIRKWAPQEPIITIGEEERFYPSSLVFTSPKPASIFYTNNVTLNWSSGLEDSFLELILANGTNSSINVTMLNSVLVELAEGKNWVRVNGTWGGKIYTSPWLDIIIDQYLPNAPTVSIPANGSNLVNVTWSHDGFDVEWFDVKAWRYEPSYWAGSVRVPAEDRWQIVQLPGSGLYYIQVVAVDAAQNEAASDVATYNVSAASVSLLSWNLSREGFSFALNNTVNVSQDVSWNLTLYTIEGTKVDYRQGILSFYPYENKTYTGNWTQNLTSNVYLAQLWLRDANGSESGFIKSFLAIPPFQEEGQIPLTILQSSWDTKPAELGEKVQFKASLLVTNANNVESPQQSVTIQLPSNVSIENVRVRNSLTGATYTATINSTSNSASFVAPAVAPYSSVSFELTATASDKVNATFTKVNGTEGLKQMGDQLYRLYNVSVENPVPYQLQVYLTDNETLKWDCPQCSISSGRRVLTLDPSATVYLTAYKLEPQEELNVTERPFSAFLTWAVSTNLGATASFFGMVIAVAAALAVGGRKYE